MTESQTERKALHIQLKNFPRFIILLALAIVPIIIVLVLLYNALFPQAFWQSRELEQNQAKWGGQHITHYQMSVTILGYALDGKGMPLRVEVKDSKVISVVDSQGNNLPLVNDPDTSFFYPETFTIPGLFSYAHQTIWKKLPFINISYDPALGYPTSIYVDPYREPCCQDFQIEIQDFQVLPQ